MYEKNPNSSNHDAWKRLEQRSDELPDSHHPYEDAQYRFEAEAELIADELAEHLQTSDLVLRCGSILGEGGRSWVFACELRRAETLVHPHGFAQFAAKIFRNSEAAQECFEEAKRQSRFTQIDASPRPFVPRFAAAGRLIDRKTNRALPVILMERLDSSAGDPEPLTQIIQARADISDPASEAMLVESLRIAAAIAKAVAALADAYRTEPGARGGHHGDLKAQNVFIGGRRSAQPHAIILDHGAWRPWNSNPAQATRGVPDTDARALGILLRQLLGASTADDASSARSRSLAEVSRLEAPTPPNLANSATRLAKLATAIESGTSQAATRWLAAACLACIVGLGTWDAYHEWTWRHRAAAAASRFGEAFAAAEEDELEAALEALVEIEKPRMGLLKAILPAPEPPAQEARAQARIYVKHMRALGLPGDRVAAMTSAQSDFSELSQSPLGPALRGRAEELLQDKIAKDRESLDSLEQRLREADETATVDREIKTLDRSFAHFSNLNEIAPQAWGRWALLRHDADELSEDAKNELSLVKNAMAASRTLRDVTEKADGQTDSVRAALKNLAAIRAEMRGKKSPRLSVLLAAEREQSQLEKDAANALDIVNDSMKLNDDPSFDALSQTLSRLENEVPATQSWVRDRRAKLRDQRSCVQSLVVWSEGVTKVLETLKGLDHDSLSRKKYELEQRIRDWPRCSEQYLATTVRNGEGPIHDAATLEERVRMCLREINALLQLDGERTALKELLARDIASQSDVQAQIKKAEDAEKALSPAKESSVPMARHSVIEATYKQIRTGQESIRLAESAARLEHAAGSSEVVKLRDKASELSTQSGCNWLTPTWASLSERVEEIKRLEDWNKRAKETLNANPPDHRSLEDTRDEYARLKDIRFGPVADAKQNLDKITARCDGLSSAKTLAAVIRGIPAEGDAKASIDDDLFQKTIDAARSGNPDNPLGAAGSNLLAALSDIHTRFEAAAAEDLRNAAQLRDLEGRLRALEPRLTRLAEHLDSPNDPIPDFPQLLNSMAQLAQMKHWCESSRKTLLDAQDEYAARKLTAAQAIASFEGTTRIGARAKAIAIQMRQIQEAAIIAAEVFREVGRLSEVSKPTTAQIQGLLNRLSEFDNLDLDNTQLQSSLRVWQACHTSSKLLDEFAVKLDGLDASLDTEGPSQDELDPSNNYERRVPSIPDRVPEARPLDARHDELSLRLQELDALCKVRQRAVQCGRAFRVGVSCETVRDDLTFLLREERTPRERKWRSRALQHLDTWLELSPKALPSRLDQDKRLALLRSLAAATLDLGIDRRKAIDDEIGQIDLLSTQATRLRDLESRSSAVTLDARVQPILESLEESERRLEMSTEHWRPWTEPLRASIGGMAAKCRRTLLARLQVLCSDPVPSDEHSAERRADSLQKMRLLLESQKAQLDAESFKKTVEQTARAEAAARKVQRSFIWERMKESYEWWIGQGPKPAKRGTVGDFLQDSEAWIKSSGGVSHHGETFDEEGEGRINAVNRAKKIVGGTWEVRCKQIRCVDGAGADIDLIDKVIENDPKLELKSATGFTWLEKWKGATPKACGDELLGYWNSRDGLSGEITPQWIAGEYYTLWSIDPLLSEFNSSEYVTGLRIGTRAVVLHPSESHEMVMRLPEREEVRIEIYFHLPLDEKNTAIKPYFSEAEAMEGIDTLPKLPRKVDTKA
jgi:hypothetical protein